MTMWSLQKAIGQSIVTNKKTAVKSCHGVGKTFLAALIICWWIDVHPAAETMVVTTAPTDVQVKKLLWEYIRKIHRKYNLSGDVTENAEWKSGERDIIAYGRKPADTNVNAFQGQHIKYLLAVIDEAGGVPQSIWTGVDAITTMNTNRILAIGNPDESNTEFGRIFVKNDETWSKFTISAFDSPNLTDEKNELPRELTELLVSEAWVEERRKKWGTNDRRYIARVLGEFPTQVQDAMFSPLLVSEGQDRVIFPPDDATPALGVDVARFGVDRTTVLSNMGGHIEIAGAWDKCDTVETATRVDVLARQLGAREVRVDGTGVGGGVVDELRRIEQSFYYVIEINGAAASPDPKQWYNYRAYLYDHVRTLLRNKMIDLPPLDPDNSESDAKTLGEELEGARYKFLRGAILMESKDEMRRRGVKSPDFSDALTYACAPFDPTDPMAGYGVGDIVTADAVDILADELLYGSPISPV